MSLSWHNAATLLRITAKDKRDAGWPLSFTPEQLATLQYPSSENRSDIDAKRWQGRMISEMRNAIKAGSLVASSKKEQWETQENQPTPSSPGTNSGFLKMYVTSRGMPTQRKTPPGGNKITTITTYDVCRESFASWWQRQGEESSVHIRAWLGEAQAKQTTDLVATETPEARRERIKARVGEVKANGTKAFLKVVAEEEGLSVSRLKQLVYVKPEPINKWSGLAASPTRPSPKKTNA